MNVSCTVGREAKLLSVLRRELGLSSSLVKRLKYCRAFTVNGVPVFTDHPVRPGDVVSVCLDEETPDYPAQDGALSILYEDEWLIAVDKPAGMLMHPSSCRITDTLANYLLGYYARTEQHCAVHPVSRLDRDTFGVVLLAKNSHVHAKMHAMQKAHEIEKRYVAAVFGIPSQPEGEIDAPIARVEGSSLLRCVRADGKPARSAYRVLDHRPPLSLLELRPLTGRTHQLRVHCAHLGFPILGDPQYFSPDSAACSEALGLKYQQLCAAELRFIHPMTGSLTEIRTKQSISLDFPAVSVV